MRNNSPLVNDKSSITRKVSKSITDSTNTKPLVKTAKNTKSKNHNHNQQNYTQNYNNDVELIVRKKLITTTTTTTMTPIDSNNQGCSSSIKGSNKKIYSKNLNQIKQIQFK